MDIDGNTHNNSFKNINMPQNLKIVKDTQTNLFLLIYSNKFNTCTWTTEGSATNYTQSQADSICLFLDEDTGTPGRFIGQQPSPR